MYLAQELAIKPFTYLLESIHCFHSTYTYIFVGLNTLKSFRINKKSLLFMITNEHFSKLSGTTEHFSGKNGAFTWNIFTSETKA